MNKSIINFKKSFIYICLISLATTGSYRCLAEDVPKEKLHVYLLIGQSNMAGRAPISKADSGTIKRCLLLNAKDKWEAASNPLNRYSTVSKGVKVQKMNPGYSFAKDMLAKNKDITLGLVVNARGGTKIQEWAPGTQYYKEAVRRAKAAQKTGTLKGILWHQGESNSKDPEVYLDQLKTLIESLRNDLGTADLPFVAGQVNKVPAINAEIAKLPQAVPSTGFVSSQGLKAMDRWHFDAKSMLLLGKRYAEEMLKILAKQKTE